MKYRLTVSVIIALAAIALLSVACNQVKARKVETAQKPAAEDPQSGSSAKVQAFLSGMVPHHESAVAMAQLALERANAPEIKTMAQAVISAQTAEIEQMKAIHRRLFGTALKPDMMAHGTIGMSMEESGMHMDVESLKTADPFDREFIDDMIPHHQGAIRMARVLLAKTQDAELVKLGNAIITAQSAEIDSMNQLRIKLYGAASPAGGVPAETTTP